MKYSDETIEAVSDSTGLSEGQLRYIFRELESTDEQKALRADAERWRKWIIAAKAPTGYEP